MSNSAKLEKIVQYIVVRGDLTKVLNWPNGAVIAQCCHATTSIGHLCHDDPDTVAYFQDMDNMHKVVLEIADEPSIKELSEKLTESGIVHKMWIEQPEAIPTCIAVKPYRLKDIQKHLRHLKLFK